MCVHRVQKSCSCVQRTATLARCHLGRDRRAATPATDLHCNDTKNFIQNSHCTTYNGFISQCQASKRPSPTIPPLPLTTARHGDLAQPTSHNTNSFTTLTCGCQQCSRDQQTGCGAGSAHRTLCRQSFSVPADGTFTVQCHRAIASRPSLRHALCRS